MEKIVYIGRYKIKFKWFWKNPGPMGRHGGGWKWELGITTSNPLRDIVFSLLFGSLRIRRLGDKELEIRKGKKQC